MTLATPHARILGIGAYRPARVVTNEEICTYIDSSDEWIRTRSGIQTRRWAGDEETLQAMAAAASSKALADAGVSPDQIGTVLLASVSHLLQTPALAPAVATDIGAGGAAALDINAGCAAFCYGLELARSMVVGGTPGYVLVVGVERLSDLTDLSDRSTAFLFGDGAGAAVVGPSDEPGISPIVWGSDGSQLGMITQRTGWREAVDASSFPHLTMQGNQVFRWASYEVAKVAREAIDRAGIAPEDLDAFIPHQANMRITDAMARSLKLPEQVAIARDIADQGNTSAASIPLAMERMLGSGEITSGGRALLVGFGAGLAYAAQVVRIP
ncbi:beta-ketoacyl-ACP synthase III [Flindersiella endophytica]